jgi:transcriptional regulator with XRE-family HTH domain
MIEHRGEFVKQKCLDSGISQLKIAKSCGVARNTVINWFETAKLPLDKILKVGKVIKYDFTRDFPEMLNVVREDQEDYGNKAFSRLREEAETWKNKYLDLLEQHNLLLAGKVREYFDTVK